MGTVFPYKGGYRFKFKDAAGVWVTVTSRQRTKKAVELELHEKEVEVERQRLGLAPVALNPEKWRVADLLEWWLDTYAKRGESYASDRYTVRKHLTGAAFAAKLLEHVLPGDIELLLQGKEAELAPGTINHLRQYFVRAFNRAKEASKWFGENPAEKVRTRTVPDYQAEILRPDEVFPFFAALQLDQRPVFAAAIFTGFRKGELCGLLKSDVDLDRRIISARACYGRRYTKNKKHRPVRIPEELVPFLDYALQRFEGPYLFPDERGAMRTKSWQPEDVLRRALRRAGHVTGYRHKCRRKGCGLVEEHADAALRECPRCGMKLWPIAQGRYIRFHDLRHTYASVLLMFGANLSSVQKLLGHGDPRITGNRYGHLLPDFMKTEVDRLRFGLDKLAPVFRPSTPGRFAALRSGRAVEGGERDGTASPAMAGAPTPLGIPLVSSAGPEKLEAGTPSVSREVPASFVAGCRGLEPLASGVTGRRYNRLN